MFGDVNRGAGRGVGRSVALAAMLCTGASCTTPDDPGAPDLADAGTTSAGTDDDADGDDGSAWAALDPLLPELVDVTAVAGLEGFRHHDFGDACQFENEYDGATGLPNIAAHPCVAQTLTGAVLVGDYDGDGYEDLLLGRIDGPSRLYRNVEGARFEDVSDAEGLASLTSSNGGAWVDIDADGDLDLVVAAWNAPSHQLWINGGDDASPRFIERAAARGVAATAPAGDVHLGTSVGAGDFDGDGYVDLVFGEWSPGLLQPTGARMFRNRGGAEAGTFDDVSASAGFEGAGADEDGLWIFSTAPIDLDGDGWLDLAITADAGNSTILWNLGDGTFTEGGEGYGLDRFGMGTTFADHDRDGDPDWFVSDIYDPLSACTPDVDCTGFTGNRLYENDGGRAFTEHALDQRVYAGGWGWGATWTDLNDDGILEILSVHGFAVPGDPNTPQFWTGGHNLWIRGDLEASYTEIADAVDFDPPGAGRGLVTLDFDRDGDRDILVMHNGDGPRLYENRGAEQQGHWLDVRTTVDGAPAVAVQVEVELAEADSRFVWIGSQATTAAFPSADAHFGLGEYDTVVAVHVHTADGRMSTFEVDGVDQLVELEL